MGLAGMTNSGSGVRAAQSYRPAFTPGRAQPFPLRSRTEDKGLLG